MPRATRCLLLLTSSVLFTVPAVADLRAGAAIVDITPTELPVLVNGGMLSRSIDTVNTRLNARAIALADGSERLVLVVVDSCMMGREVIDDAKALAASRTGLPTDRIVVSATHTHTAPSSMACLGTEADAGYIPFLRVRIADAIAEALDRLEPAEIGYGSVDAADFTALRRWIRRPDRIDEDPFGNRTVRANMHSARNPDDVTGESGPEDPELALIGLRSRDGRPIAVLANFSMHYYGDRDLSADYFGLFCNGLQQQIAGKPADGAPPFVAIMSHGCSGDIWRRDYTLSEEEWDAHQKTIEQYTAGLLDCAMTAWETIAYRSDVTLAMAERRMVMRYRVPDQQRVEWAERIVAELDGQPPKTRTQVYAREQLILHERQQTEIVVQGIRIGDIGIATTPNETYAVTGLKIKAASPLEHTMVIELANGGDGYIPPPEQHLFGGYNTWAARSAGLEVTAEPKITAACVELLEQVSGSPRRSPTLPNGPVTLACLAARPVAYWRLNESSGPIAVDATGQGRNAFFEPEITYYLPGPRPADFCGPESQNRAPMFVGGRLRAHLPEIGNQYSVSLWFWNGMPSEARDVTGWLLSRGPDSGLVPNADHVGIGGTATHTGRLLFVHGNTTEAARGGTTEIPRWTWQHLVYVRDGANVQIYLNGTKELDAVTADDTVPAGGGHWYFGGRSDNHANWEGRLDEVVVFARALTADQVAQLHQLRSDL